ncbi:GATA zinc finger domain-containing protein 10 [Balamuthia mandrillaris]
MEATSVVPCREEDGNKWGTTQGLRPREAQHATGPHELSTTATTISNSSCIYFLPSSFSSSPLSHCHHSNPPSSPFSSSSFSPFGNNDANSRFSKFETSPSFSSSSYFSSFSISLPTSSSSSSTLKYQHQKSGLAIAPPLMTIPLHPVFRCKKGRRKSPALPLDHRCAMCGATKTPEWRKGPKGPRTLCNACGLHFSRHTKREKRQQKRNVPKKDDEDIRTRQRLSIRALLN